MEGETCFGAYIMLGLRRQSFANVSEKGLYLMHGL